MPKIKDSEPIKRAPVRSAAAEDDEELIDSADEQDENENEDSDLPDLPNIPEVPEVGHIAADPDIPVTKDEARVKRGRGRPRKPFVSKLPKPPAFEITKPDIFFKYLRSIPKENLTDTMLVFYRYLPVADLTEGGTKAKDMEKIPGESHPFDSDDWEGHMLHRYGSGSYGVYMNENNRTICRCLKIMTQWNLDAYPPIVDPKWVDQTHPLNRSYIQWCRMKNIQLPSANEKEQENEDMQVGEAMRSMTDTIRDLSLRQSMPVPPSAPSAGERLTLDAAKAAIDIVAEQAKTATGANTQASNPLEMVNSIVAVAEKIAGGKNAGGDPLMMMMLEGAMKRADAAEARSNALIQQLLTERVQPPKSTIEQLKELAETKSLLRDVLGVKDSEDDESEGESKTAEGGGLGGMLLRNLPQISGLVLGLATHANTALHNLAVIRTAEAQQRAVGAVSPPTGPIIGPPPMAPAPVPAPPVDSTSGTLSTASTEGSSAGEQLSEAQRAERAKYVQYHGFISTIAQPIFNHLNDADKDGYDFAEWFINGQGRMTYETLKGVGTDNLYGAIASYDPLWSMIGGAPDKVKEFIDEFMTYDDFVKNLPEGPEGVES